jgi:hypothetical protein
MVSLAAYSDLGIDLCGFGSPSFYLALDRVLFPSIASSAFLFSVKPLFDFILLYCVISGFFAVGNRFFFAGMGLSAIGVFIEDKFSIVARFNV